MKQPKLKLKKGQWIGKLNSQYNEYTISKASNNRTQMSSMNMVSGTLEEFLTRRSQL